MIQDLAQYIKPSADQLAAEIIMVKAQLEAMKPLYDKLDQLTMQLKDLTGIANPVTVGDTKVMVIDNFAEKNCVFRPAGVRRFEIKLEEPKKRKTDIREMT